MDWFPIMTSQESDSSKDHEMIIKKQMNQSDDCGVDSANYLLGRSYGSSIVPDRDMSY